MNILVDENIPNISVAALRDFGHQVFDIRGTDQQGLFDDELWNVGQEKKCLLISTDKGFVQYRSHDHFGILVIRLRQPNEAKIHAAIMAAMHDYSPEEWPGLLVVVRDRVRSEFRRLPS
jgi:predicted nuclease of predicted toxin-antitoxin system